MNSKKLTLRSPASFAGYMFLFFILMSIVHYTVIELNLAGATVDKIKAFIVSNEVLFRTGIVIDLVLFMTGLVITITLYDMLLTVSRSLAMLAVLLMLVHTTITVVIEFSSFVPLILIDNQGFPSGLETDHFVALAFRLRATGYHVTLIFFSLAHGLFCYLFWKSGSIPTILSLSGALLYLALLMITCAGIVVPGKSVEMITQITAGVVMLHQVAIGLWLIGKGVNLPEHQAHDFS